MTFRRLNRSVKTQRDVRPGDTPETIEEHRSLGQRLLPYVQLFLHKLEVPIRRTAVRKIRNDASLLPQASCRGLAIRFPDTLALGSFADFSRRCAGPDLVRWNRVRDDGIGPDHGALADPHRGHDRYARAQPHVVFQRDAQPPRVW